MLNRYKGLIECLPICPRVQSVFVDFTQKTKTCHIFLGSPVSYIEGPNWQILAQQVLKNKVLSHRFLLYRVYER